MPGKVLSTDVHPKVVVSDSDEWDGDIYEPSDRETWCRPDGITLLNFEGIKGYYGSQKSCTRPSCSDMESDKVSSHSDTEYVLLGNEGEMGVADKRSSWEANWERCYRWRGCEGGWGVVKVIMWIATIITCGALAGLIYLGSEGYDFCAKRVTVN